MPEPTHTAPHPPQGHPDLDGALGAAASTADTPASTEADRPTWRHRKGCRYMPVFGDFYGNPTVGCTHEWSGLAEPSDTWAQARRDGFEVQDSDDFNIAVIEDGRVTALLWMTEDMTGEMEQSEMDGITDAVAGWLR